MTQPSSEGAESRGFQGSSMEWDISERETWSPVTGKAATRLPKIQTLNAFKESFILCEVWGDCVCISEVSLTTTEKMALSPNSCLCQQSHWSIWVLVIPWLWIGKFKLLSCKNQATLYLLTTWSRGHVRRLGFGFWLCHEMDILCVLKLLTRKLHNNG